MCVVSAINDWGRSTFPDWQEPIPNDVFIPTVLPTPSATVVMPSAPFTLEEIALMKRFLKLLSDAKKLDEAAGLPNCEDPEKAKFEEAVEKRLKSVEDYLERFKKAAAGQAEA